MPDVIILDDGSFQVALNVNYPPSNAPGFLERRCFVSASRPGGFECVGGFDRCTDGLHWSASISTPYDAQTDSDARTIGVFDTRLDAIVALWRARHKAQFTVN